MEKQVCGVYCIENQVTLKKYIGSSKDILYRFKHHLQRLRSNRHSNTYLQSSYNKHGISAFKFTILEECSFETIYIREQFYIDSFNWEELYNLSKIAIGGGSDAVEKEVHLLSLSGDILNTYKSGSELARDLNLSIAPYFTFNTKTIVKRKYRIVTPEYYLTHLDTILSWRAYSNETEYQKNLKKLQPKSFKYKVDDIDCNTRVEVAKLINMSSQGANLLLNKMIVNNLTTFVHKSTGKVIHIVK